MNQVAPQVESAWASISTAYNSGAEGISTTNSTVTTALTTLYSVYNSVYSDLNNSDYRVDRS